MVESQTAPSEPVAKTAQAEYAAKGNCKKTLLAMAIGIRTNEGDLLADIEDKTLLNRTVGMSKKQKYLPNVQILDAEVTRRTELYKISPKFKGKKLKKTLIEWLSNHVISDPFDVAFLINAVQAFKGTIKTFQEAQEVAKDVQTGAWRGHAPYLRLIHCVLDKPEMRRDFQLSYQAPSREELDGRVTNELPMVRFWKQVATLFADSSFVPKSCSYGYLHSDFAEDIDLSAVDFDITPEKAKSKFVALQAAVNGIKSNWETSGNGDGCADEDGEKMEAQDKLEEMEENPSMFSERAISRKRDFAAHLEKKTQYENDKLCSFQDQLETVRAEEGAVEEEEDDDSSSAMRKKRKMTSDEEKMEDDGRCVERF